MGQRRNSRLLGAGLIAALAMVAMACSNDGGSGSGGAGARFEQPPAFNSTVLKITPAADGSGDLYVGGDFTSYNGTTMNRVARLHADGTLNLSFATGDGFDGSVWSIALAGDGTGDLYVGGAFTSYNGRAVSRLVRLHADGTVNPTFQTGTGFNNTVYSIAPAADGTGNLYVGGAFTSYNGIAAARLVRLQPDGLVDLTFTTGTGFTGPGLNTSVRIIVPAADGTGKLYVGGDFTSYNQQTPANDLVRVNPNGSADLFFATGTGFNNTVYSIALAADGTGDLYVGGAFTSYNQQAGVNNLVRLHANGIVNPTFATGTGFDNTVYTIAPAGDGTGNLYVGGAFTTFNGPVANDLVRLHANGTVDPAFATGTGFDNTVYTIAPAGDGTGNLYVGGAFTTYQSSTAGRIVRLSSQGSTD
jgi:beta-propeller uncharacterized protein DUF5122